jgi:hypothetical protein
MIALLIGISPFDSQILIVAGCLLGTFGVGALARNARVAKIKNAA